MTLYPATDTMFVGHAPQSLDKDERYTPKWVFDGLGLTFDLDPASPGDGQSDCVPALVKVAKREDGLSLDWFGMVWLNPPFSNLSAWSHRFVTHGNGVWLGPFSNSRDGHKLRKAADLMWLCNDFAFTHPTHAGRRSSMPLLFASFGAEASLGLRRLALSGRHDGVLVKQVTA